MSDSGRTLGDRSRVERAADGLPWRQIAEAAYNAYRSHLYSYPVAPAWARPWDEMSEQMRASWEAAVRHAQLCEIHQREGLPLPAPERWAGWVPPT
jgi:hypothetical protein